MSACDAVLLQAPFSMIVACPSRCGKTTFVYRLLLHASQVMTKSPGRVLYFYNQWQPLLREMWRSKLIHALIPRLPTVQDLRSMLRANDDGLVVVDDFMKDANSDLGYMFTALSHHHNVSVIFLSQNIFSQHGPYRDMSLSATYLVYFKNPRDGSQIAHFARQFCPDAPSAVVRGYRQATKLPYSSVLFDFHPRTPDYLRMRTRIFPDEGGICVIEHDGGTVNGTLR